MHKCKFSEGDLVRVVKQPDNQIVHIKDSVCIIDDIQEDVDHNICVYICTFGLNGVAQGFGWVHDDCLEHESSPEWIYAKKLYIKNRDRKIAEMNLHSDSFNTRLEQIAKKHGLSIEKISSIYNEVSELKS